MFKVANGENIFLWLDSWHPDGILHDLNGHRVIYDAGSQLGAKLSSVLVNKSWNWQPAHSDDLVQIQSKLPMVAIGDFDHPTWMFFKHGVYNCAATWDVVQHKQQPIRWWRLVWFPLAIPQQAFILWLAARDSLSTGVRLLSWGFGGNVLCVFCCSCLEDINHLFIYCIFCKRICLVTVRKCLLIDPPSEWDNIVDRGVKDWSGKGLRAVLCRLCLSASVYNLWKERNSIRHGNHLQTEEQILKRINWEVRRRIMLRGGYPRSKDNEELCSS